ncbi:MAG: phytase [Nitrospirae bacterium]|nr:phytase [Nitrospirota bacterium]
MLAMGSASAQNIGPSTTVAPYLLPSFSGVQTTSILTVGDSANNGYRMVGIPDGLGAFKTGQTFDLLMNHELSAGAGIARDHGSTGAFVSRWSINRNTLEVLQGRDHTPSPTDVYLWNPVSQQYTQGTTAWDRLCSADLPPQSAFYHAGVGTPDLIFLDGEEVDNGRAWARVASGPHAGEAWQLPRLGRLAYENVVASPHGQSKTVVMLMDDGNLNTAPIAANFPSELYVYVGDKQKNGHPVEQAGLTNGQLYGVKVYLNDGTLVTEESNDFGFGDAGAGYVGSGRFTLVEIGDHGNVSNLSALQFEEATIAAEAFRMRRIEDGAWDPRPRHKNDFYFVTTGSFTTNSRLWRLRYDDIQHPEQGGSIEILLRGNEGQKMFDNMAIDLCGRVLLQEDPGNQAHIAKVWLYATGSGNFIQIAHHNPAFFDPALASPSFLTRDEESSGIIDAQPILGQGWFLLDVQAHVANADPELVQGGQLLSLRLPPSIECAQDD